MRVRFMRVYNHKTVERICEECNNKFTTREIYVKRGDGRFCSLSCASKYGNRIRSESGFVKCCMCDKIIWRKRKFIINSKNHYCSRKCKSIAETKGFQKKKCYGSEKHKHYLQKAKLIEKYGIKCQVPNCPNDLMNDKRMVQMHHFNGAFDHESTVLLCPYHHVLVHNQYLTIDKIIGGGVQELHP